MEFIGTENIQADKWYDLSIRSNYISPFQTPEYYNIIKQNEGFTPYVFATEEDGIYTSLVVVVVHKEKGYKSFFTRRGIIYGGPLFAENESISLSVLLKGISQYFKSKVIFIEIRNFFDYSEHSDIFLRDKWEFLSYLNYTIELQNLKPGELLSSFSYNRRREIRLSIERDASYKECETQLELRSLYNILEDLYKKKVKLPLPNFEFFFKLWQSEIGKVFVVLKDGKVLGGCFCVILKKVSIYTMYYCGLRDFDKKIFPTHLAILAALDFASQNGIAIFDFMGAGLKNKEYGVRQYKQEFGGRLNEYGRYRKILNPFWFKIGELGLALLKKAPTIKM